ncbi:MAG: hypothetical protein A3F12_04220 [Gammaproteobacteria bacterium RIFCSPHIGHO2_12_FULL_38_14]|nr:MAG: hypothetical protein A3F12_04220 [Gammaproteobacteria bacterium RIFCSPHIGHO2_12_FULL_38_14]
MTEISLAENLTPFATVKGQAILEPPKDLYIPPEAMQVFLETFEGPLDLLLYLIRKENIDILDIPIAAITQQYIEYIDMMRGVSLELAAEYLVMAAILAEIKSRMLLPKPVDSINEEDDPRAELVRRLQEYERYKQAALDMNQLPRVDRDTFIVQVNRSTITLQKHFPQVSLADLTKALSEVMQRAALHTSHQIQMDTLSVREKMSLILSSIQGQEHLDFAKLFVLQEGRMGVVVTFLALLELIKQSLVELIQATPYAPIYLKMKAA